MYNNILNMYNYLNNLHGNLFKYRYSNIIKYKYISTVYKADVSRSKV